MIATLSLISCVLAATQPANRSEWLLLPRLNRAQELVYHGTFTEESTGNGIQFQRDFLVETRVLVLNTGPRGANVAFLTILKHRNTTNTPVQAANVCSVRLEPAQVDLQGRLTPGMPGVLLSAPVEGPPTIESGAFVPLPRHRIGLEQPWQTDEESLLSRTSWRVVSTEPINNTNCLKLVGVRQSDDWEQPRGDHIAWRRQDTVWLSPETGFAYRVQRLIEHRDPRRRDSNQRSLLRYDLESNVVYPRPMFEDRWREIQQAKHFAESAAPFILEPTKYKRQIESLLEKIAFLLERQPQTPYREAVLQIKHRLEAAQRGETPPTLLPEDANIVTLGRPAPEFLVPQLGVARDANLRQWLGRPLLLIFYHPASKVATEQMLRFGQSIYDGSRHEVVVLGFAMSNDVAGVQKQRDAWGLTFPFLNGTGLRRCYAVEATPKLMVLDAAGVVQSSYLGWGMETPEAIRNDLKRLARPK